MSKNCLAVFVPLLVKPSQKLCKLLRSYPQTAVILMGSFMTLVFGVLNLVVAVVVDTFAKARCMLPVDDSKP